MQIINANKSPDVTLAQLIRATNPFEPNSDNGLRWARMQIETNETKRRHLFNNFIKYLKR